MPDHDPQKLEAFVHRTLRELPELRAPDALEARVLARLAERQQSSARHRGWMGWPVIPRTLALLAGLASAVLMAWLLHRGFAMAGEMLSPNQIATHPTPLSTGSTVIRVLTEAGATCLRSLQPYLIALFLLLGGAYATLVGLGASLYRSLFSNR